MAVIPKKFTLPNKVTLTVGPVTVKVALPVGRYYFEATPHDDFDVTVEPALGPVQPPVVVPPPVVIPPTGNRLPSGGNFVQAVEALKTGETILLECGGRYDVRPGSRADVRAHGVTISTYGDGNKGRAMVVTQGTAGVYVENFDRFAIRGVEITSAVRTEAEGIVIRDSDQSIVDDCEIHNFREGLQVQGFRGEMSDFDLINSVIRDNWYTAKSQGIYASRVRGLRIRGNVIDRNGYQNKDWSKDDDSALNHNIYIQSNCSDVEVTDNVISRASSHGLQARSGGTIKNNVFLNNPIDLTIGFVVGAAPKTGGVFADVEGNVFIGGGDVENVNRGWVADIGNAKAVVFKGNLIAHKRSSYPMLLIQKSQRITGGTDLPPGAQRISVSGNYVYDTNQKFMRIDNGFNVIEDTGQKPPKTPDLMAVASSSARAFFDAVGL